MNRFPLPILCFILCLCTAATAQTLPHQPGAFLVSLTEEASAKSLAQRLSPDATIYRVSDLLNIWLLQTDLKEDATLIWLRQQPEVRIAQFNHLLENRTLPNDPHFPKQWHLRNDGTGGGLPNADLDAEHAWEISTGGLTPAGDTIVLAVIDGGIQKSHPDLAPNLWTNWVEIPNNGLDDDQNGYVDDFRGWNVFSENDNIEGNSTSHGTPVSAILGAKGNNQQGVTGVNWNTKIMFVSAAGTESEVIAAFDYVLRARKRYNNTWGAKGAFVVAVNCSWGINYGQPSEAPLWCEAFDKLGAEGILSVAATANLPVNVDEVGDLPTACPSNFLIGVTSLNSSDLKATNAAWGPQNVDIGGYGQEVFTAGAGSGYDFFSGTSFAAPEVAGAVGLLYAAPCPNLIALAKSNPAEAAAWVKNLILENATPNLSLTGISSTGGRLNLYNSLKTYESQCNNCPAPYALKAELISDESAKLLWTKPADAIYVNLRWRKQSNGLWNQIPALLNDYLLVGLPSCTNIEFQLQSICEAGVVSAWSPSLVFQTQGCCTAPSTVWAESIGADFAKIAWESSSSADYYQVRIRRPSFTWSVFQSNSNDFGFDNLSACTDYEVQVQAHCVDVFTDFSPVFGFHTKGCGACNEIEYCSAKAGDASEEWISKVLIGAWDHNSGSGGGGYQNFSLDQITMPVLKPGELVPVVITPGFFGAASKEYYRIFVDYNQDGDFEDGNELAYDPGFAHEGTAEGWMVIPDELTTGISRMRVMMKFTPPNEDAPLPCGNFEYGQVEDYCVTLLAPDSVSVVTSEQKQNALLFVYPQPASDWVLLELPETLDPEQAQVRVSDLAGSILVSWKAVLQQNRKVYLDTSLWPSGVYMVQIWVEGKVFSGKIFRA